MVIIRKQLISVPAVFWFKSWGQTDTLFILDLCNVWDFSEKDFFLICKYSLKLFFQPLIPHQPAWHLSHTRLGVSELRLVFLLWSTSSTTTGLFSSLPHDVAQAAPAQWGLVRSLYLKWHLHIYASYPPSLLYFYL